MKPFAPSNILFAVFLLCLYPSLRPVHAYLDPGNGSYIIQIAVASFFSAAYATKLFWHRIIAAAKRLFSRKPKD